MLSLDVGNFAGRLALSHLLSLCLTWQDAFLLVWILPDKNLDANASTPQTPQTP
jgi:hypothetical protein